jgi:20S proteasome alpha/beta subunit
MTYCVAMRLSDGLVFASDSRTNAGSTTSQRLKTPCVQQGGGTGAGDPVGGEPGHNTEHCQPA